MRNLFQIAFELNTLFDSFSYKQNKITGNEKELTIAVQKYPAIFDKSNKDFRHKDVKRNAWEAAAEEYLSMTTVKGK